MTWYKSMTLYAFLIIATGVVLMALAYFPGRAIQYLVAAGILFSAVFAFLTAYHSQNMTIQTNYHWLHGFGMAIYGLTILFWANDIQKFSAITAFFLLYYGMAEMIFCFQLLMRNQKYISAQVIGFRLLIGFFIAIGAVFTLATAYFDRNQSLLAAGAVFVFSGVYLLVFKSVIQLIVGSYKLTGRGTIHCKDIAGNEKNINVKVTFGGSPVAPNIAIGTFRVAGIATGIGVASGPEALLGTYYTVGGRAALIVGAGAVAAVHGGKEAVTMNLAMSLERGLGIQAGFNKMTIEALN